MEMALQLVGLLNASAPVIASLLMMIKRPDGTISVVALLDEADSQFQENIDQAQAWLAAHPAVHQ